MSSLVLGCPAQVGPLCEREGADHWLSRCEHGSVVPHRGLVEELGWRLEDLHQREAVRRRQRPVSRHNHPRCSAILGLLARLWASHCPRREMRPKWPLANLCSPTCIGQVAVRWCWGRIRIRGVQASIPWNLLWAPSASSTFGTASSLRSRWSNHQVHKQLEFELFCTFLVPYISPCVVLISAVRSCNLSRHKRWTSFHGLF